MSLASLSEDIILLLCFELRLLDILSLRQACRSFSRATRAKVLWIFILERQIWEGNVLPTYMKGYDLLDSVAVEALACRVARLDINFKAGLLSPVSNWRLDLPQSITWLRLVAGSWLFVASSDNHVSKISCWNLLSVFGGCKEPLAEAYLPGQVKTAKLEVQDSGIVLALGLCSRSQAVHMLTLQKHLGGHAFSELGRISGSSHVLMLCGDLVGCALRNGTIVPHIINWKTYQIRMVPELDIPGRRSVPHLMTIRKNLLVLVRTNTLQFYTLDPVITLFKAVETPTVWEAAVCNYISMPSLDPSLQMIFLSAVGIEMCVVDLDALSQLDDQPIWVRRTLAERPPNLSHDEPWYRLCAGETGRRNLWISAERAFKPGPHFIYTSVPLQSSEDDKPGIVWTIDDPDQPALWGLPVLDIDEALGLTVIGNCFGELAIYDHAGGYPERCSGLGLEFADQESLVFSPVPTQPIPLCLSVVPPRVSQTDNEYDPSMTAGWGSDDIDLGSIWSKHWGPQFPGGYPYRDQWQGIPTDAAWVLEHAYGFPGPVIPQAHMEEDLFGLQRLLFRVGTRYLVFTINADPHDELKSYPVLPSIPNRFFDIREAQPELYTRRPAINEGHMYKGMLRREMRPLYGSEPGATRRNRWIEQAERGGRPHENLLFMPPIFNPADLPATPPSPDTSPSPDTPTSP
ncbi:hypothetical protein K438DRAFT_1939150 [Mycena galopus ATCC 62051]|nr:hypothetical protein K438DRAFT_1939150 [Mycena galopus ATCC 62051]